MSNNQRKITVAEALILMPQRKYESLKRVFEKFPDMETQFLSLVKRKSDAIDKNDADALRDITYEEERLFTDMSQK